MTVGNEGPHRPHHRTFAITECSGRAKENSSGSLDRLKMGGKMAAHKRGMNTCRFVRSLKTAVDALTNRILPTRRWEWAAFTSSNLPRFELCGPCKLRVCHCPSVHSESSLSPFQVV